MAIWPNSTGREERGIVPAGASGPKGPTALSVPARLFFCALGGAVASTSLSAVAPALVAYGYGFSTADGARGRAGSLVAALVPAAALSLSLGPASVVAALACCLVAVATSELVARGRFGAGAACLVVAAAAAACLAADALVVASAGTTIPALVNGLLDTYLRGLGDLALVQSLRAAVTLLWPVAYVVASLVELLAALLGTRLAADRSAGELSRPPRLVAFDVPLWVVAALVASAAGLAAALTVEAVPGLVLMVSANVAMALRFAFAAQGLAVLVWFVRSRSASPTIATLLGVAALYLEAQFFVLTVAGLVDVWANFRHLARGGSSGAAGGAKQD